MAEDLFSEAEQAAALDTRQMLIFAPTTNAFRSRGSDLSCHHLAESLTRTVGAIQTDYLELNARELQPVQVGQAVTIHADKPAV